VSQAEPAPLFALALKEVNPVVVTQVGVCTSSMKVNGRSPCRKWDKNYWSL